MGTVPNFHIMLKRSFVICENSSTAKALRICGQTISIPEVLPVRRIFFYYLSNLFLLSWDSWWCFTKDLAYPKINLYPSCDPKKSKAVKKTRRDGTIQKSMDSLVTTPTPTALPPSEMRLQSFRPVCTLQVPSEFHRIRFLKDSFTQPASLTTSVPHGVLGLLNNNQHVCANLYLCWRHWCLCHLPKIQELELHAQNHVAFTDCYCTVWSYLSSTRLILHVVSGSNLGADIL